MISKSLEAYGGEEALIGQTQNAQIFGKLIPPTVNQNSNVYYAYRKFRKGSKWRVDLEAPPNQSNKTPMKRVLAFNGLAGWRSISNTVSDLKRYPSCPAE